MKSTFTFRSFIATNVSQRDFLATNERNVTFPCAALLTSSLHESSHYSPCKNLIAGTGEVDKVGHNPLPDSTKTSTQQKISKLQPQLTHLYIPVSSLITVRVELDRSVWLCWEYKIGHCNTTAINEDLN